MPRLRRLDRHPPSTPSRASSRTFKMVENMNLNIEITNVQTFEAFVKNARGSARQSSNVTICDGGRPIGGPRIDSNQGSLRPTDGPANKAIKFNVRPDQTPPQPPHH